MVSVGPTLGSLMIGGIVAAVFSGMVTSQAFSYVKFYQNDPRLLRALVIFVWFLDVFHTIFVSTALWDHLIQHFGDVQRIDFIPWSLAITIAFTAVLTFLVHLFFVHRIFKLSKNNYYFAIPLGLLACARVCAYPTYSGVWTHILYPIVHKVTTAKMIKLRSLHLFVKQYTWSFTLGLSISSLLDVLITSLLVYLLQKNHKKNSSLNHVLDSLMLYTFENGSLTCAATVTSLICWLTMKHKNLVFMGIHFVISKFYANSLLATLNSRKNLHQAGHRPQVSNSSGDNRNLAIMFPGESFNRAGETPTLKIKVDQTKMSRSDHTSTPRRPSFPDPDDELKSSTELMEVC